MYCVGLTGNIASGKSTVLSYFQTLGITVISADAIAREITKQGQEAYVLIRDQFGKLVIKADGELDRKALRHCIFSNADKRRALESILHPRIKTAILLALKQVASPYCVIEIPLLTDRKSYPYLDRVLLLLVDYEASIQRAQRRDETEREEIVQIIQAQPSPLTLRTLADDILYNNGSIEALYQSIKKLHQEYLHSALKKSS